MYLKYMDDLSADYVLTGRVENLYWQYMGGMKFFEHVFPIDPSGMIRWRHRIEGAGVGRAFERDHRSRKLKAVKPSQLSSVNVDTMCCGQVKTGILF